MNAHYVWAGELEKTESRVFHKVLQGHACGVVWPCGWLLNLFSQVCLFVLEIITSVAPLCSAPLPRPLCRHVFICLVIIARSWMSRFRDSAWVWVNVCVCVSGDWWVCEMRGLYRAFIHKRARQWWSVDTGVCENTVCLCMRIEFQSPKKRGHHNWIKCIFSLNYSSRGIAFGDGNRAGFWWATVLVSETWNNWIKSVYSKHWHKMCRGISCGQKSS